jgi:hypothetical protein
MAYLLHAKTVEPQKQPLLSNTPTQQYNNGVVQSVSRQRPDKHIPRIGPCCATRWRHQQYGLCFPWNMSLVNCED